MTVILILMGLLLMSWVTFCGIQDILFPPLWRPAKNGWQQWQQEEF